MKIKMMKKTFKNIDRNQAIQIAEEFLKEKNNRHIRYGINFYKRRE